MTKQASSFSRYCQYCAKSSFISSISLRLDSCFHFPFSLTLGYREGDDIYCTVLSWFVLPLIIKTSVSAVILVCWSLCDSTAQCVIKRTGPVRYTVDTLCTEYSLIYLTAWSSQKSYFIRNVWQATGVPIWARDGKEEREVQGQQKKKKKEAR